jgi:hypothetical protein
MKGVAALGKQAELLVVFEFAETDRALERFFGLRLEALHEIVAEHRKAFDDGSGETTVALVLPPGLCIAPPRPSSRSSQAFVFTGAFVEADRETAHDEKRAHHDDEDNRNGCTRTSVEAAVEIIAVFGRAIAFICQSHARKWGSKIQILRVSRDEQIKTSAIRNWVLRMVHQR